MSKVGIGGPEVRGSEHEWMNVTGGDVRSDQRSDNQRCDLWITRGIVDIVDERSKWEGERLSAYTIRLPEGN